jgi:hypothetical protein
MTRQSRLPKNEIRIEAGHADVYAFAGAAAGPGKSSALNCLIRKYLHPRYSFSVIG